MSTINAYSIVTARKWNGNIPIVPALKGRLRSRLPLHKNILLAYDRFYQNVEEEEIIIH
jgi:hypothetical protein